MLNVREKLIELLSDAAIKSKDLCLSYGDWGCGDCLYQKEDAKGCRFAIMVDHLIANGVTVQRWIPVTERLPEETRKYIVCTAKGSVYCTKFYTKRFGTDSNTHITHWMPLPEAPKDGE